MTNAKPIETTIQHDDHILFTRSLGAPVPDSFDGPVFEPTPATGVAPSLPGGDSTPPPPTAAQGVGLYRPVSYQQQPTPRRGQGIQKFSAGDYAAAARDLQARIQADPAQPAPRYFYALALRRLGHTSQAQFALAQAARVERSNLDPVMGGRLERIQGSERLWVESARR